MDWLGLIVLCIGLLAVQGDASGYGFDDETSGRGDMEEGSAYEPELSPCQSLREKMRQQAVYHLVPQCQDDGNFEKKQCSLNECWCVNVRGSEIVGTKMKDSEFDLNCDNLDTPIGRASDRSHQNINSKNEQAKTPQPPAPPSEPEDGIGRNGMPETASSVAATVGQIVLKTSVQPELNKSPLTAVQPGILAGIIGGAVVGLLCAVLFVMFIVYRMRKKDEGSYALEEQKQSSGYRYQQANTKEFYA